MLVKQSEFTNYLNIEIISNNEDGLFAVEYEPQLPLGEPKLEHDTYSWRYGDKSEVYTVVVSKPTPRNIVRTVIVRRTSTNNYLVTYADRKTCDGANCKTLSDVHAFLEKHWTRRRY